MGKWKYCADPFTKHKKKVKNYLRDVTPDLIERFEGILSAGDVLCIDCRVRVNKTPLQKPEPPCSSQADTEQPGPSRSAEQADTEQPGPSCYAEQFETLQAGTFSSTSSSASSVKTLSFETCVFDNVMLTRSGYLHEHAPYSPKCATFVNFSQVVRNWAVTQWNQIWSTCNSLWVTLYAPYAPLSLISVKLYAIGLSHSEIRFDLCVIVSELRYMRHMRHIRHNAPLSIFSVKLYVIGLSHSEIRFHQSVIVSELRFLRHMRHR